MVRFIVLSADGLYNTAVSMNGRLFIVVLPLFLTLARAETEISAPETSGDDQQEMAADQEWEAKGVIPDGGLTVSTQPITPIMVLPERNPYDQSLQEVAAAQDLFAKGKFEAASDVALEAYDDLMSFHLSRHNKKKRLKMRADRHQAATLYIDSSIAYIKEFVQKHGSTAKAKEEGHARLGDLHDVAQDYPELNKKLNQAFSEF
jgi:hypothetical protein